MQWKMTIGRQLSVFNMIAPMLELHHRLKWQRAKHNQGFDGSAPVTEVSVNLKIYVQRVGLHLCKGGLGAAYWARISWLEDERRILKKACAFPSPDAGSVRFEDAG
jgi:hypothetical protein